MTSPTTEAAGHVVALITLWGLDETAAGQYLMTIPTEDHWKIAAAACGLLVPLIDFAAACHGVTRAQWLQQIALAANTIGETQ